MSETIQALEKSIFPPQGLFLAVCSTWDTHRVTTPQDVTSFSPLIPSFPKLLPLDLPEGTVQGSQTRSVAAW